MYQSTHYRTLFEIYIRHGYLLDNGMETFDTLSSENKQKALERYRFDELLSLVPTGKTSDMLTGQRLLHQKDGQVVRIIGSTKEGSTLPVISLADETVFVFLLRQVHPKLPFFTEPEIPIGRMLLLANDQPDAIETEVPLIPLRQDGTPPPSPVHISDDFLLSEDDTLKMLEAYTTPQERIGVMGMVFIRVKGTDADRSLLNTVGGTIKANWPKFLLHFDTKVTFWRYIRETVIATTFNPLPLTRYGYIELDPATDFNESPLAPPESDYTFPNPMLEVFEMDGGALHSVIFI